MRPSARGRKEASAASVLACLARGHTHKTSSLWVVGLAQKQTIVLIGCVNGTVKRKEGPNIPNFCECRM